MFGKNTGKSAVLAKHFVDQDRLAQTNILFEAASFPLLAAKAVALATQTGWSPV